MKQPDNEKSFEKRMERLESIVTALEDTALPLDKGIALYKEGMDLSRACREQLEAARNEIQICTEQGLRSFDCNGQNEQHVCAAGDKQGENA